MADIEPAVAQVGSPEWRAQFASTPGGTDLPIPANSADPVQAAIDEVQKRADAAGMSVEDWQTQNSLQKATMGAARDARQRGDVPAEWLDPTVHQPVDPVDEKALERQLIRAQQVALNEEIVAAQASRLPNVEITALAHLTTTDIRDAAARGEDLIASTVAGADKATMISLVDRYGRETRIARQDHARDMAEQQAADRHEARLRQEEADRRAYVKTRRRVLPG